MLRKLTAVALCAASLSFASDRTVAAKHLLASSQRYNVTHDVNGFKINGQRVHDYDVDASLRKPGSVREFFRSNYSKLAVSRIGNDYAIKRHEQLKGGGIVAGTIGYWTVKALGYGAVGGVIAGAGTAAVIAAPVIAPIAGPVAATVSSIVLPGAGLATTVATGIATGIATTASTVAVTNGLAMGAVSVAASTGGIAGVAATIETSATTVGWFLTCIPWLP